MKRKAYVIKPCENCNGHGITQRGLCGGCGGFGWTPPPELDRFALQGKILIAHVVEKEKGGDVE